MNSSSLKTLLRPLHGQLVLAVVASAFSGVTSMLLVALINRALAVDLADLDAIGAQFALVSVLSLFCRWLAEERFARLGQLMLAQLRLGVNQRIMALPYLEFERIGVARCNAALTEDANSVAHACSTLPGVTINAFLVLAALAYMAQLSLPVFGCVALVLLVGVFGYAAVELRALRTLRQARSEEDDVFRGFDGLLDGAKDHDVSGDDPPGGHHDQGAAGGRGAFGQRHDRRGVASASRLRGPRKVLLCGVPPTGRLKPNPIDGAASPRRPFCLLLRPPTGSTAT